MPWSLVDIYLASKLFAKLYYMNLVRMDLNRQPWIMKHLKWTVNVACAIKYVIKEECYVIRKLNECNCAS